MTFDAIPVFNKDGSVLLYDCYVDGKWIGSRRTPEQCELARLYQMKVHQ